MSLQVYEFFCGGGMARAGLGDAWTCRFANDIDPRKAHAYAENWGPEALHVGDVAQVSAAALPGRADLAWASFPCQDLSLAGAGAGIGAEGANAATRSGAFWPFLRLMRELAAQGRAPAVLALENVTGVLTANGGRDFTALVEALARAGWRPGALVIDARLFTPQSRARVFVVALRADAPPTPGLARGAPDPRWTPPVLLAAHARLPSTLRQAWAWWRLPAPSAPALTLEDVVEDAPAVPWRSADATAALLAAMSPVNRAKVEAARAEVGAGGGRRVGFLYRRTRPDGTGGRVVRAEVRFDGVAGCLRTPAGGSSRQTLLVVDHDGVRSRLISAREAARLMGLPDSFRLPARYGDAYHVVGDGVAPPVVRHLSQHLLEPLAHAARVDASPFESAALGPDPRAEPSAPSRWRG